MSSEKRTIHVVVIDNYFPELCELTLPTIEYWAKKIGARVNLITKRRWPDWPILYEKMQVFYEGLISDWNILLDADILVDPSTIDPLNTFIHPVQVAAKDAYHANTQLHIDDPYFFRDGRNIGLSTCAIFASRLNHDIWTPLDMTPQEACSKIKIKRMIVDEYCISRNFARFGLKLTAPCDPRTDYDKFYHLGAYAQDKNRILELAKQWHKKVVLK
jgi:hypothetical protein